MNLEGKVCLVTGGVRGIGAATALRLARAGADVAVQSRDAESEAARETKAAIEALGRRCISIAADMAVAADAALTVEETVAGLGGIDVLVHNAGAAAYATVKGAIPQFTRVLAREMADHNIRVNCISPGVVRTRFQDMLTPAQVKNNLENRIPLHREGTPEEIAQVIEVLATNDFMTGSDVVIDGGLTMRIA